MNFIATDLGTVLRNARLRRGLTLRELGKITSIDHTHIHRVEHGVKTISTAKLEHITRALGCTLVCTFKVKYRDGREETLQNEHFR